MAYCVVTDVDAQNASRTDYSGSTIPTSTQVQGFVDDVAGEIDTILAVQGVTTPVASPARFVSFLKRLNALGAAAYAEMAAFPEQDQGQGATPQGDRLWKMYQDGLASLKDGSAIDPDAPMTTASSSDLTARSWGVDNPDTDGEPPDPLFSVSKSTMQF